MNRHRASHLIMGSPIVLPLLIAAASIAAAPVASADPVVTPLYSFTTTPLSYNHLVVGPDKFVYGCRSYYNYSGSDSISVVYRFAVGGATKTLATFPNSFGLNDIINAADGNLIVVENSSNTNPGGAILEVGLNGAVTTLASFDVNDTGAIYYPSSILLGQDGNYYGTSVGGGTDGTLFEMSPVAPHTITVLHDFGQGDGVSPNSLIQAADGSFYGTTEKDKNAKGNGVIFKVLSGHNIKVLHTSTGDSDGIPTGLMQAKDGTIYGVTSGARNYPGTIFTLGTDDHYSLVYTFSGADGATPLGIIQSQRTGNLYGYTVFGGAYGDGTFYELNPSLDSITTLYSFDEPGPTNPDAMVLHPDGKFYGISVMGGTDDDGTFFSLAVSGTTPALDDELGSGSL